MAELVRARRWSEDEGRRLQQILRRRKHESIRIRRAMITMASASGTLVAANASSWFPPAPFIVIPHQRLASTRAV